MNIEKSRGPDTQHIKIENYILKIIKTQREYQGIGKIYSCQPNKTYERNELLFS